MERILQHVIVVHFLLTIGLEVDEPLPPSKKRSLSQSNDKIPSKTPR